MADIKFNEAIFENAYERYRKEYEKIAKQYIDDMEKEYLYTIRDFYKEYEPRVYYRHFNNDYSMAGLVKSGLGHTYRKGVRWNAGKTICTGFLTITDAYMFDDYEHPDQALEFFLRGYHGHPRLNIHKGLYPYENMIRSNIRILEKTAHNFGLQKG